MDCTFDFWWNIAHALFFTFSLALYIVQLVILIKYRHTPEFQGSAFKLIISLGIMDVQAFIFGYLLNRMPNVFPWYSKLVFDIFLLKGDVIAKICCMLIFLKAPGIVFATCMIAFNRMTAIIFWNQYKVMWTEARLNAIIAVQWIICFLYILPMVRMDFMIGTKPTEALVVWFTHGENGRAYFDSVAIIHSVGFVFLIGVNSATVISLRIKNNKMNYAAAESEAMRDREQSQRKMELRITLLCLAISTVFLINASFFILKWVIGFNLTGDVIFKVPGIILTASRPRDIFKESDVCSLYTEAGTTVTTVIPSEDCPGHALNK